MRHKVHVRGDRMSVVDVTDPHFAGRSAKRMARDLLGKYHNGPGDTIEAAAYRVQSEFGVDDNTVMQGWNREPRGMLTHRWLPLFQAWCAAGFAKVDALYEDERARHVQGTKGVPEIVRLADLVAGKKTEGPVT